MTKAVRERAMLLLQLAVNHNTILGGVAIWTGDTDGRGNSPALMIARDARIRAATHPSFRGYDNTIDDYSVSCLEAEAMLRDGWSP